MSSTDLPHFAAARLLFGVGVVLCTLTACTAPPGAENGEVANRTTTGRSAVLSGTVTYLPRIALPPNAVVHVRLEDVSLADVPATTLAEQTIPTEGRQVPIPFMLTYDPSRIEPRHRYTVRAEIRSPDEGLLWTTDTMHPVLTNGAPSDSVEVRVFQTTAPPGLAEAGSLVGTEWQLVRIETSGGVVTPEADEPYTIIFGADGRYNGQADCNRYGGEYEAKPDGSLELSQGLSTLAACPPPSSSDAFFRVLNAVERYGVTGDQLRLDADDDGGLVFQRMAPVDAQEAGGR